MRTIWYRPQLLGFNYSTRIYASILNTTQTFERLEENVHPLVFICLNIFKSLFSWFIDLKFIIDYTGIEIGVDS